MAVSPRGAKVAQKITQAQDDDSHMLDLSWCEIDDALLKQATDVLPKSIFTQVWLNNNKLTDAGASALAACCQEAPQLRKLWVNGNKIGDAGVSMLARVLPTSSIDEFWSIGNSNGDAGVCTLADALPQTKLATLWIWGNNVGDTGTKALAAALAKSPELFEVGMGGNQVTNAGISELAKVLPSTHLKELYLRWNWAACDAGLLALAEALPDTRIEKLSLDNSNISDTGLRALTDVLEDTAVAKLWVNGVEVHIM